MVGIWLDCDESRAAAAPLDRTDTSLAANKVIGHGYYIYVYIYI